MKTNNRAHNVRWVLFGLAITILPFSTKAGTFVDEGSIIVLNSEQIDALQVEAPAWADEYGDDQAFQFRPAVALGDALFALADVEGPQHSGFSSTANKWTNNTVYYRFDPNVNATNQERFRAAAAEWSAVANLTFLEDTAEAETNYIHVQDSTGNSSFVGMIGGAQALNMFNWSYKFIICHEIAHALGQMHEQSRSDRDTYVTILTENIQSGKEHNFNKGDTINYGTYDFDSTMHYPKDAFSTNGQNTIEMKPAYAQYQDTIGQRDHLSDLDKSGMAAHYGDPYEINNFLSGAFNLNPHRDRWLSEIHGVGFQGDNDWFKVQIATNENRLKIDCTFSHDEGNIDIDIHNADGQKVGSSVTTNDNEFIEYAAPPGGGVFYIKVYGDDADNTYDLRWSAYKTPIPGTVTNVNASRNSKSHIRVSWKDADLAAAYDVYRGTSPGNMKRIARTKANYFVDKNVKTGVDYYYYITAVNQHGIGNKSVTRRGKRFGNPDISLKYRINRTHGENIYYTYNGQTVRNRTTFRRASKYTMWVQNDSSAGKESIRSHGSSRSSNFEVSYYSLTRKRNITSKMVTGKNDSNLVAGKREKILISIKPVSKIRKTSAKMSLLVGSKFRSLKTSKDRGKIYHFKTH